MATQQPLGSVQPLPPCDRAAEHEVCALMALSPVFCGAGRAALLETDFFDPFWRRCFADLKAHGYATEEFVPRVYQCQVAALTVERVQALARRIRDLAERRRIISAAARIAERAWDETRPFTTDDAGRLLRWTVLPAEQPVDALAEAVIRL